MKVGLISSHSFDNPGGVKNHILGLYGEFKKKGINTKIIAPRRKASEDYGKDVILLGTSFPLKFAGTQADLDIHFNPLSLEKTLKEENFDVLHFHNFGFPSTIQILERSKSLNILTFHANLDGSRFFKSLPVFLDLFNGIINWKIDGIIGVAALNLKPFRKFSKPKIVIPNGIDLKEFGPDKGLIRKFASKDKINILFVGRIEERKGLIYLLEAYKILEKRFDNLRLIIVGSGPLKQECEDFVRKNGLKEVYFEGYRKDSELPRYFSTCDIFCSPAIFGESFGIVLLEALASGKPITGFSNLGYKEFMRGKMGERFLAQPKDSAGLAQRLGELVGNEALRKKMGEWGLKEAQKYSWDKISQRVLDFYEVCRKAKQS
jgi:phosphatidylinositol alpha-mannosyltransferase